MKRLVGLLGWLGLILVVIAVIIRFAKPEWQSYSQYLAIAGLVVTALYAATQWRDIARTFQGRNARYGSLTAGSVVVFAALLVGINYISNRQNKRWDLTAAQQFSLSDQTKNLLKDLKKPVKVTVYYDASDPNQNQKQSFHDALDPYQYVSSQFTVDYIDASKEPTRARADNVDALPTTVFAYDGRTERTTGRTESDFTNALKKIIVGTSKKIFFVQGHGEHDPDATDRTGYSQGSAALKGDNFDVGKVALAQEGKIPADATVLIIDGPHTDYLPAEIDMLRAYLKGGGKLLMMLDPIERVDSPPLTNLIALAKEWGMEVDNDYVLDESGIGQMFNAGPEMPIAVSYPPHAITTGFNVMTIFPLARSVSPINGGNNGHTAQTLVQTSRNSWGEMDLKGLLVDHKASPDAAKGDKLGPVSIATAVSAPATNVPASAPDAPKPETRVVVIGNSNFANNTYLGFQGDRDLFVNTLNWLAQQENLIAIHPREAEDRRIQLTQDQASRIFWLTFAIIPGLLFLNGIRVWWRRR